jgi:hypothetical protein
VKNTIIWTIMMAVAILFAACNHTKPKQGQVVGVLHNPDGTKYSENVSVFVINDKDMASGKIQSSLESKTNRKGEFALENIKEGHFALFILEQPKFDREIGTENVPTPVLGQISNKGKPFYFTMPANEGINLGDIEVTSIIH